MEDRLAVISCIISDPESVSIMNEKLHLRAHMIIARLGVPCREYGVSVVSVVLHGTQNEISSFAGDLGKVKGVKVKSIQVPVTDPLPENRQPMTSIITIPSLHAG